MGFPCNYHSTNAPYSSSSTLLLPGQTAEAWERSQKKCSFGNPEGALNRGKYFHLDFKELTASCYFLPLYVQIFSLEPSVQRPSTSLSPNILLRTLCPTAINPYSILPLSKSDDVFRQSTTFLGRLKDHFLSVTAYPVHVFHKLPVSQQY